MVVGLPLRRTARVYRRSEGGLAAAGTAFFGFFLRGLRTRPGIGLDRELQLITIRNLRRSRQPVPVSIKHEFETAAYAELVKDGGQVVVHGGLRNEQALGDRLDIGSTPQVKNDLTLAP